MIESNKKTNDDEAIRLLIKSTYKKAPDKLKYRVMNSIEMESMLSKRYKTKRIVQSNTLKDFWSIFGVMYLVIVIVGLFAYLTKGGVYLKSIEMIGIILFISIAFSFYWLLTRVEERYRRKHN